MVVGHARHPGTVNAGTGRGSKHRQRVGEDEVILLRLIVHIVATDAEVEWACEARCDPEFLAQLPGVLARNVLGDKPVAASQLRIAKIVRSVNRRGRGTKAAIGKICTAIRKRTDHAQYARICTASSGCCPKNAG